jgi:uncharacterized membrane protein (DUF2068 family)
MAPACPFQRESWHRFIIRRIFPRAGRDANITGMALEDASHSIADQASHLAAHVEPLRWIGAYKLVKAILATVAALMVLRLEHRHLPTVALVWMNRLHIDPTSRFGHHVLMRITEFQVRRLIWFAVFLFGYSIVNVVEGVGLICRKTWAEWLTVVTTSALIPYEAWRFTRRPDWVHAVILVLNVLVVVYLVWRIRRDQRARARRAAGGRAGPSARTPPLPP